MSNMPFVIWMIGFPLSCSISKYLVHLRGLEHPEEVVIVASVIELVLYIWIATLLYSK